MKFVTFDDPTGKTVVINVDLIRSMSDDEDRNGDLTEIAFANDHKIFVRGSTSATFATIVEVVGG